MFAAKNTMTTFRSFLPFNETNTARTNQPVPAGAAGAFVTLIGGGGSGGGGAGGTSIGAGSGGGGGGGAGISRSFIPAGILGPTYSVTIGTAGSAGSAGAAGNPGTATTFSSGSVSLSAGGGGGGGAGTTGLPGTAGSAGSAGTVSVSGASGITSANGSAGGAGSITAATGNPGGNNTSGGAPGGGGGAYRSSGNTPEAGGAGGNSTFVSGGAGGAGNNGGSGTAGSPGTGGQPGGGGGGGGSSSFGGHANGGAGGTYGGGGGGGGGGDVASSGGAGAAGYALIEWVNNPNPVLFDSVGSGTTVLATTASISHTIATGAAVLLWVEYAYVTGSPGTITANVGSTPMTLLSDQVFANNGGFTYGLMCFSLMSPPSGTQTITTTSTASEFMEINSVSYLNVRSFSSPTFTTGSGTSASMSVSSSPNNMVSQSFVNDSATTGTTLINYNQATRYITSAVNDVTFAYVIGDVPGSSSVSFNTSWTSTFAWIGMAVDINCM